MKQPVVYLDLDRTIFQTKLSGWIWEYLEQLYPNLVNAERQKRRSGDFYVTNGDMYCYDMSTQLIGIGLEPAEAYGRLVHSSLADGRMEFDGAAELVAYLKRVATPRILTYGIDDYQRFKAALCPSLSGLPIQTTLVPKSDVLASAIPLVWLVDDKSIGADLPSGVRFIQVNLEHELTPTAEAWPICSSLKEVKEVFIRELH